MKSYADQMGLARRLLNKHGLQDWNFDICNLRNGHYRAAIPDAGEVGDSCGLRGLCLLDDKEIKVHFEVTKNFQTVVLHEIAHALLGKGHDHDIPWMEKAEAIGVPRRHVQRYWFAHRRNKLSEMERREAQ